MSNRSASRLIHGLCVFLYTNIWILSEAASASSLNPLNFTVPGTLSPGHFRILRPVGAAEFLPFNRGCLFRIFSRGAAGVSVRA